MLDPYAIAAVSAPLATEGRRIWLVGGAVRDVLLHRMCDDVDLAVGVDDGDAGARADPDACGGGEAEVVARALGDTLDGAVFCYSERFPTWRVDCEGGHVDVAPLRAASIEDDLRGRDFTLNALAREVGPEGAGELSDPCGGLADLRAGRLALCSPDAFVDDPIRILRLARLRYELDLTPAHSVEDEARAAAGRLAAVSGERIEHELTTLLGLPAAAEAVRCLADLEALAVVLPEVEALHGVTQNPYHHLDVFDHTLEALAFLPDIVTVLGGERFLAPPGEIGLPGAPPLAPLAWAVLLHDTGKPAARRVEDDGRVTFFHHDQIGERLVHQVAARLHMSRRFADVCGNLVRQHLRLGFLVRDMPLTRRALVRYRRSVEPFVFEAIALSLADRMATRGERTPPQSLARHFRITRDVFGDTPPAPRRLLSGDDVMVLLGVPPGQAVGRALDALQEEIDCGEVTSEGQARAFLLGWWEREQEEPSDG